MMLTIVKLFFLSSNFIPFDARRATQYVYICVVSSSKRFMPQICLNAFNSSSTASVDVVVMCTKIL